MNSSLIFLLSAAPTSHEPQLIDLDQTVFVQLGIFLLLALVLWHLSGSRTCGFAASGSRASKATGRTR